MSKGHGRIERAILEAVAEAPVHKGLPMSQLAAVVYSTEQPTRSQTVSLRRAVGRLTEEELVSTRRDPSYSTPDRHYWRRTGRTIPCEGEGACSYCAAGHDAYGDPGEAVHEKYVRVSDVVESWVVRSP